MSWWLSEFALCRAQTGEGNAQQTAVDLLLLGRTVTEQADEVVNVHGCDIRAQHRGCLRPGDEPLERRMSFTCGIDHRGSGRESARERTEGPDAAIHASHDELFQRVPGIGRLAGAAGLIDLLVERQTAQVLEQVLFAREAAVQTGHADVGGLGDQSDGSVGAVHRDDQARRIQHGCVVACGFRLTAAARVCRCVTHHPPAC